MRGRSLEIEQPKRFRFPIRSKHMGLAAGDEDKITLAHGELSSFFDYQGSRAAAQVVKNTTSKCRQSQGPRLAQLVVVEQRPAQANASQNVSENIQDSTR